MDKNHFVVKAEGKQKVDVYFSQTDPLTSCVAKITIRDGEEVKHYVVASGISFWNPKDKWDAMIGKRKAFGKMKDHFFGQIGKFQGLRVTARIPVMSTPNCWVPANLTQMVYDEPPNIKGKPLPTEREFERAFYEWMKEN